MSRFLSVPEARRLAADIAERLARLQDRPNDDRLGPLAKAHDDARRLADGLADAVLMNWTDDD